MGGRRKERQSNDVDNAQELKLSHEDIVEKWLDRVKFNMKTSSSLPSALLTPHVSDLIDLALKLLSVSDSDLGKIWHEKKSTPIQQTFEQSETSFCRQIVAEFHILETIMLEALEAQVPASLKLRARLRSAFQAMIQDALKSSELDRGEPWQAICASTPVGLSILNLDGSYLEANPHALELLGYSIEELKSLKIFELTHPDDVEGEKLGFERLRGGTQQRFQNQKRVVRKDQSHVWVRDTISFINKQPDHPLRFIVVSEDISEQQRTEQALRASEERLRATITYTQIGVTLFGLDGHFIDANPAFYTMLGYTREEILDLCVADITHPDYIAATKANLQELLSGKIPFFRIVKKYIRKNGAWIWAQSTVSLVRDGAGKPYSIVAITEDISQRVQTEEGLARSQEQLALAVSVSKVGFFSWDSTRRLVDFSEQIREDLGMESQDNRFSIEMCLDFIHADDRAQVQAMIHEFNVAGDAQPLECRAVRRDGETIWLELRGHMTWDANGQPLRFLGTSLNITRRKQIEEDLRTGEEQLRLAAERMQLANEAAKMGIWDYDPVRDRIQLCKRAKEIMGFQSDQDPISLFSILERVHPDDQEQVHSAFKSAIDHPDAGRFELTMRIVLADKKIRWVLTSGQWYSKADSPGAAQTVPIIGALLDVTSQSELQEELKAAKSAAEHANSTKSAFLANMSHEIRTPLSAILGFSNLLLDGRDSSEEREQYLKTIIRNGRSLLYIIDDILDLSKVEAGRLDLEKVPIHLRSCLEDVIDLFREKAKAKDIALKYEIEDEIPELICSDPTRIRQILINLLGNAIKFTEQGSVIVTAQAILEPNDKTKIQIAVKDTGIGLTLEQRSRLFQAFTQADNSTTRKFGGTGLGLYLAKRLAQALQGDVTVDDCEIGEGCTFVLFFLAELAKPSQVTPEIGLKDITVQPSLIGTRILLAEDALDNQLLIQTILSDSGAKVELASNGMEAVEKAMSKNFDLILMDLQMPLMDGYEATRTLRERGYENPIIALTAHGMLEERKRTKEAGCNHHLTKPLDAKELLDTVRHFS